MRLAGNGGKALWASLAMILAPLVVASTVALALSGGPYWAPIAGFFGAGLLVATAAPATHAFLDAQNDPSAQGDWMVALKPDFIRWAAEEGGLPSAALGIATWTAWALPAIFFAFLVLHAVVDLSVGR